MTRQIIDMKAQKQEQQTEQVNLNYAIFDVQGKIVLPGTRERVTVHPIRVVGENTRISRMKMSADLVSVLNERYGKDLPEGQKFSPHFAMMHLRWERVTVKAEEKPAEAAPEATTEQTNQEVAQ